MIQLHYLGMLFDVKVCPETAHGIVVVLFGCWILTKCHNPEPDVQFDSPFFCHSSFTPAHFSEKKSAQLAMSTWILDQIDSPPPRDHLGKATLRCNGSTVHRGYPNRWEGFHGSHSNGCFKIS